jgi:hypothetical protein
MALSDLEAFIQQRLSVFDDTLDVTPGSPLDTKVIQPILRRLGSDPFTVDFVQFAQDRLAQEFPDLTTKDGDAITDLLIKPGLLLLDPLVREHVRLKNAQSFKDPTTLTTDEADALGANLFAIRDVGNFARGQARIYFATPQSASVSPANFVTSNNGLHFFPTQVQSIRPEEMLFNVEGTLYYFDINVVAERQGDEYNIDPESLTSIANITSAVKVTNKRRFRFGVPAEDAVTFVGRAEQELSERSLVTQRGIIAKITAAFSEVTEVAVVGFNDPEMHRDILEGGGLGDIQAAGFLLHPAPDGANAVLTRRITIDAAETVDFVSLIGPPGPVGGFTLTIHGGFSSFPLVRDLKVVRVVNSRTLDLEDQVLAYSLAANLPWVLRKNELTLSGIPGGILFPNTPSGTIKTPSDELHIGGATDMFVRATDFDTATLVLSDVVDDFPVLSGTSLNIADAFGHVLLEDLLLGTTYGVNDATYNMLLDAFLKGFSLQILDGAGAGSYRVISVTQNVGQYATLLLDPIPVNPPGLFRWRLLDVLDVDLAEPKETKITGSDLVTTQNVAYVQTASGADFQSFGVGPDDILRIFNGPDAGDYTVKQVLTPFYQRILLDRSLTSTGSNLKYAIFRPNAGGGVKLPFIRIDSIDLLDSSGQSTGSKVPYAKPIDIRSRSFANVAHGVKEDLTDGILGLVGLKLGFGANVTGRVLAVQCRDSANGAIQSFTVSLGGGDPVSAASIVSQINTAAGFRAAVVIDTDRVGILPFAYSVFVRDGDFGDNATIRIFGTNTEYSSSDVRSPTIEAIGGAWNSIRPTVDINYDVLEVLDGFQIGFYDELSIPDTVNGRFLYSTGSSLIPEVGRHIRLGARSLGTARLYFLEPTTIEFGPLVTFSTTLSDGSIVKFLPDKTLDYQKLPPLPSDPVPADGVTSSGPKTLSSASADFFRQGIHVGDKLHVTYQPITGSAVLADPVLSLTNMTIILSVGGGVDKTVAFVNDSASIGAGNVTRRGVADQINKAIGLKICSITATNHLEFEADQSIIIRSTGTANMILGFSTTSDVNNTAAAAGIYTIASLTATLLTVIESVPASASRQHYLVFRPNLQRIVSTTMATQLETAGLYYCDVELISQGAGDQYNIPANLQMTAEGYLSDGYWLTTVDPDLTFSTVEKPFLHVSRSILEVGVSDSPLNATQISGQNLQINYERSSLTSSIQSFASSEEERVICQSPLVRHLVPYFVRFDANYVGGSKEDVVIPEVSKFINELKPADFFEVSDLEKLLSNRGAVSVQNPIDLIAVIHNFDRSISVERSQDKINVGRLAAFVPDALNIVRKLA